MKNLGRFRQLLFLLLGIPVFILVSCNPKLKVSSKSELKTIVEKQNELLESCFKGGDANKLAEMYADSAKLSPNGGHFIFGRDSIRAFWTEDFKTSKVLKMVTNVLTVDGNENLIYETGVTVSDILYNDSLYHPRVKYINVWRKQADSTFKLDVDFWNKDAK